MRLWAIGLVFLAALGCRSPYGQFDAGVEVHVIVWPEKRPKKSLAIRPTVTLGTNVVESPVRTIGGRGGPRAIEVAQFRLPKGEYRLSIWEPRTRTEVRKNLEIEHEIWVVLVLEKGARDAKLNVHDEPPAGLDWQPLVAVPD